MGGQCNLSLSSHHRDDDQYNAKRNELRQYLPQLERHLQLLRSRGQHWQQCGTYTVLYNLYQNLTEPTRVPIHVLLGGEDLLKREVLNIHEPNDAAVECIWRSSHFRMAIRQKLEDTLKSIAIDQGNSAEEEDDGPSDQESWKLSPQTIEAHVFAKSRTKDEYLELSARVIIHFKHLHNELRRRKMEDSLHPVVKIAPGLKIETKGKKRKRTSPSSESSSTKSQKVGGSSVT